MHQAEAAHHLGSEVPFFAAEGGAAGEGNPLRAVDHVTGGILGDEGRVAGFFDALGQLAEHVVPADLLPVVGTRRAIHGVIHPASAGGQLHRRGTFGTQPPFVDRTVRVAFDLQELATALPVVAGEGHQGAPDGAVRAKRMRLGRALNAEALLDLASLRQIESEGSKPSCAGPGGADFQKVAARNLWHPIPPRKSVGRRLRLSLPIGYSSCQPIVTSPAGGGGQGGGVIPWPRDERLVRGIVPTLRGNRQGERRRNRGAGARSRDGGRGS